MMFTAITNIQDKKKKIVLGPFCCDLTEVWIFLPKDQVLEFSGRPVQSTFLKKLVLFIIQESVFWSKIDVPITC